MKVLITGAGGQLGYDLFRLLHHKHEVIPKLRLELDVCDGIKVQEVVLQEQPQIIIHSGAYTNVDGAENDAEKAYEVNSVGTKYIATAAQMIGAKLVYVSTDYVFDGLKEKPYYELDQANPLSVYGKSKLLGERQVRTLCERYFNVRTSWLYGKGGTNFVTKIIDRINKHRQVLLVNDQIGSPTYSLDLARMIEHLIETERYGLYHASNRGACSRYEFGLEIIRILNLQDVVIHSVPSSSFPLPAERPAYSVLDDRAIRIHKLPRMREWKIALQDFLLNDLSL